MFIYPEKNAIQLRMPPYIPKSITMAALIRNKQLLSKMDSEFLQLHINSLIQGKSNNQSGEETFQISYMRAGQRKLLCPYKDCPSNKILLLPRESLRPVFRRTLGLRSSLFLSESMSLLDVSYFTILIFSYKKKIRLII